MKQELIGFLDWLRVNNFHLYKDGTYFTTSERPYMNNQHRKFYTKEELVEKYIKESEK
jgi:hypothetical protein